MSYQGKHESEPSRTTKKLAIVCRIAWVIKNVLELIALISELLDGLD